MDLDRLRSLASDEFKKYELTGWTFGLTDAKARLGVCKYASKRIEIGEYYASNSPENAVIDTLLHEIAHAIAGHRAAHGPVWKAVASRIGATPKACNGSKETVVHPGDWQTTCPACGKTFHRYRKPFTLTGYRCKCPARTSLTFAYKGHPAYEPHVPMTRAEASGWKAKCAGCGRVHTKIRRPKAGTKWTCKCGHPGHLVWRYEC